MQLFISRELPAPIKLVVDDQVITSKKVEMVGLTGEEIMQARITLTFGQFNNIGEMALATKIIGDDGTKYQASYESIAGASAPVFHALEVLAADLDAKVMAESSEI